MSLAKVGEIYILKPSHGQKSHQLTGTADSAREAESTVLVGCHKGHCGNLKFLAFPITTTHY